MTAAPCDLCAWFERQIAQHDGVTMAHDRWVAEHAKHIAQRHRYPPLEE